MELKAYLQGLQIFDFITQKLLLPVLDCGFWSSKGRVSRGMQFGTVFSSEAIVGLHIITQKPYSEI